jgi:hypothetical protein
LKILSHLALGAPNPAGVSVTHFSIRRQKVIPSIGTGIHWA